jgi:hypothetical protein
MWICVFVLLVNKIDEESCMVKLWLLARPTVYKGITPCTDVIVCHSLAGFA